MNAILNQPQQQHGGSSPNNNSNGDNNTDQRQTHLTKFAFLLSSARGEGSDEPVVGMHHDVEMAACFSNRHLNNNNNNNNNSCSNNGGGMMMNKSPPSISSSSLSMQSKNGSSSSYQQAQMMGMGVNRKEAMLEMAAMNMSTPFYTTPDTVSSTAKTVLKNIVTTMDELMDSRLRSTVSQLVHKAGGITNSQLLFRLLSTSRNPIQVATVITRFVLPDDEDGENNGTASKTNILASSAGGPGVDGMLSIPLQFKAILDVKVFGEVSTIELSAPVTMSGKFDPHDGLLTAVDVSFDCVNLLKAMIPQARLVVKTAVTKAAALSVQIAEWHAKKKAASLPSNNSGATGGGLGNNATSVISLHSLLGSTTSLGSLSALDNASTLTSLFSMSSMSNNTANKLGIKQKNNGISKGLLRESGRGLLRNRNMLGTNFSANNANATFDFGNGMNSNNNMNRGASNQGNSTNVVRFRMPSPTSPNLKPNANNCGRDQTSFSSTPSTSSSNIQEQCSVLQQQQPEAPQEQQQQETKGNIHAGLFSWIQDDSMFLTEEKIKEQNEADAERERKLREAPMPLRFFTAAEDLGGGECGLEMVSKSIFGNNDDNGDDQQVQRQSKKRRVW